MNPTGNSFHNRNFTMCCVHFPVKLVFFSGERPGRRLRVYSGLSSAQETPSNVVGGPRRAVPTSQLCREPAREKARPGDSTAALWVPFQSPVLLWWPTLLGTSENLPLSSVAPRTFALWPGVFCSEPLQAQAKSRPIPFCFEVPLIMEKNGEIPNQGYKIMYVV